MKEYNKLVRDNIPEIIEKSGKVPVIFYLEGENFLSKDVYTYRRNKIREEVEELLETIRYYSDYVDESKECIEELADVIETLWYFLYGRKVERKDMKKIFKIIKDKRNKNGAFDKNIILQAVYDKEEYWGKENERKKY